MQESFAPVAERPTVETPRNIGPKQRPRKDHRSHNQYSSDQGGLNPLGLPKNQESGEEKSDQGTPISPLEPKLQSNQTHDLVAKLKIV